MKKNFEDNIYVVDFSKTFLQNMAFLMKINILMSFYNLVIITASFSFARALYDIKKKQ